MLIQQQTYTSQELWDIATHPDNAGKKLELFDGVIYEKISPSFKPSMIGVRLAALILAFVDEHHLGYVTGSDGGYVMSEDNKFIPDVGYISKQRLPEIPEREVPVPPDFAIEVFSPTDSSKVTHRKAMKYLELGTRMVWVVYPDDKLVDVYRPGEGKQVVVETVNLDSTLEDYDILPGLSISLAEIFKGLA